ncbi:MAG: hypothetical protein ACYC25_00370 [Paludibacter sp.]
MKKVNVLIDFIQISIAEKIVFLRTVLANLTGHATFTDPDQPLADGKVKADKLESTSLAAKDGSHTAVSAMRDAEKEVDTYLRKQAGYINRVADGNETLILSSGFHTTKQTPNVYDKLPLEALDGKNSGSVLLKAKAIDKAGAYIWQISRNKTDWTTLGHSTRASFEVDGLTVGEICYFRVAAITPNGTTDFTEPVMKVVV